MRQPILILIAGLVAAATGAMAQDRPVLTVYTYDSFTSDWGPGPVVEKAFEKQCGCDLKFVGAGDGAALLARLRLEGRNTPADVVLGLDTSLVASARETGLFAPNGITADFDLPVTWDDPVFLPYDWGYFAFVYDRTRVAHPPESFAELIASDLSIVIEDPRSSTPGLGLLLWVKSVFGDRAPEIWAGLNRHVVTVTKGWTEAYGMFLAGEADMVLSYTTSPAYHMIAEQDDTKAAAAFRDGHYMQVEVAARVATSDQSALAEQFLRFMLSDAFQSAIPTTNWMYPAVKPSGGLPEAFDSLVKPTRALLYSPPEARRMRDQALSEWLSISSR